MVARAINGEATRGRELPQRALEVRGLSIGCRRGGKVRQTSYRYLTEADAETMETACWLLCLTDTHRNWGFGMCFLYLRNERGFGRRLSH